jgi:outer membrane immunogenic protein
MWSIHRVTRMPFQYEVKQTIDLVKVGVNYKFGWAQPVVAKY